MPPGYQYFMASKDLQPGSLRVRLAVLGSFTLDIIAQLLSNPALRANYADFVMIAGVENPLVVYARKDTPPGLKAATDIMRALEFKALDDPAGVRELLENAVRDEAQASV